MPGAPTERTLAGYIRSVRDDDPSLTLEAIARRGGLPLATVGAYATGARGALRPPSPDALTKLAKGLRRPPAEVFEAAGRTYPKAEQEGDLVSRRWTALGRDLTEEDRAVAEAMLRAFRRERGY